MKKKKIIKKIEKLKLKLISKSNNEEVKIISNIPIGSSRCDSSARATLSIVDPMSSSFGF